MPRTTLAKNSDIIIRVTIEGTSRTRINEELQDLMDEFSRQIRDFVRYPEPGREILSYDIYVAGDPQLGFTSKAKRSWVKSA